MAARAVKLTTGTGCCSEEKKVAANARGAARGEVVCGALGGPAARSMEQAQRNRRGHGSPVGRSWVPAVRK